MIIKAMIRWAYTVSDIWHGAQNVHSKNIDAMFVHYVDAEKYVADRASGNFEIIEIHTECNGR